MENQQVLNEFIERVRWLQEVEYGDFKRKMGLYLNRLSQDLKQPSPEVTQTIEELKMKIVYDPSPDIEAARELALEQANKIVQKLKH